MRILITAGPTREHIDPVRFITNASSGRMGYAVAQAALDAGHDVTLLSGPVAMAAPAGCRLVRFVTVADLKARLVEEFPHCDALVMSAAVGDFTPERPVDQKMHRSQGPILLRLVPTEDILAGLAEGRQPHQRVAAFCVEDGTPQQVQAKARAKMIDKHADCIVANGPQAMAAADSEACIITHAGVALPWARRGKDELARRLVRLLEGDM